MYLYHGRIHASSLRAGSYIIGLYQVAFRFVENKAYLVYRYPLSVSIFLRVIPLDNLLKRLINSFRKVVHHLYFQHINMIPKDYGLTEEEKLIYSDRVPHNLTKLDLLGKGGFALVWLC